MSVGGPNYPASWTVLGPAIDRVQERTRRRKLANSIRATMPEVTSLHPADEDLTMWDFVFDNRHFHTVKLHMHDSSVTFRPTTQQMKERAERIRTAYLLLS